jgi:ribosomal protein L35
MFENLRQEYRYKFTGSLGYRIKWMLKNKQTTQKSKQQQQKNRKENHLSQNNLLKSLFSPIGVCTLIKLNKKIIH